MIKILFSFFVFSSYLFANVLYTDDYHFKNKQIEQVKQQDIIINQIFVYEKNVINDTKDKKAKRKKRINKCDIARKMLNNTYYNPSKKIFYIGNVKYETLPQEFKDCNISFNALERESKKLTFHLDNNTSISGIIAIDEDDLDENFFYTGSDKVEKVELKSTKKVEKFLAICNFVLPYGIRVALDEFNHIIHLPLSYINQTPELYYQITKDGVYVSNNGFGKIKLSKNNFEKNCKVIEEEK